MPKKEFREIFSGFQAMSTINYVVMAVLMGTKRKIELDEKRIGRILKNEDNNTEKINDATGYQKHYLWPYYDKAKPELIHKLVVNSGMKDFRYDWLIRAGKMFDYCEITARLMRKTTGLTLKSSRVTFDKVNDLLNTFKNTIAAHDPSILEDDNWGAVILPGSGSHFICLEFVIMYNPNSQSERNTMFSIFDDFITKSMENGIYFTNHSRLYREHIEKTMMPKIFKVTNRIRKCFGADITSPK